MTKQKSRTYLLRLIAGTLLLVIIAATMGYGSEAAGASVNTFLAPARQIDFGDQPTNQIIIKYRATAIRTGVNALDGAARMNALSTAAGETLTYKRVMSGNAHVLSLSARKSPQRSKPLPGNLQRCPTSNMPSPIT